MLHQIDCTNLEPDQFCRFFSVEQADVVERMRAGLSLISVNSVILECRYRGIFCHGVSVMSARIELSDRGRATSVSIVESLRDFLLRLSIVFTLCGLAYAYPDTTDPTLYERCTAPDDDEAVLGYQDFRWGYSAREMDVRFGEIYHSGKRLMDRARWNEAEARYELIMESGGKKVAVPITKRFIDSVRSHIETALHLGYVRHVFFPDMGHAHLLIDQTFYDEVVRRMPVNQSHHVYVRVLDHPRTRYLYHTAEQLEMLDDQHRVLADKYLGWRYYTRNLVGRNDDEGRLEIHRNLGSLGNTVCKVNSQHRYWSSGFHVSASKDGCFSFRHQDELRRFDISLADLPAFHDGSDAAAAIAGAPVVHPGERSADSWGIHTCQ